MPCSEPRRETEKPLAATSPHRCLWKPIHLFGRLCLLKSRKAMASPSSGPEGHQAPDRLAARLVQGTAF